MNFENILNGTDWASIRNNKFTNASVAVIGSRAWAAGLECASEGTLFRMVAIIAYAHGLELSQETAKDYKIRLQNYIKGRGSKRAVPLPYITHYPVSAAQLPADILNTYDGDIPTDVEIPDLDAIQAGWKMRLHKKAAPAWLEHVPKEYRHMWEEADAKKTKLADPQSSRQSQPAGSDSDTAKPNSMLEQPIGMHCNASLFRSGPSSGRSGRPAPPPVNELTRIKIELDSDEESTGAVQDDGSLEDMEMKLLAATKAKTKANVLKRPSAKDAAAAPIAKMKKVPSAKPAAAKLAVNKKPAAAAAAGPSKKPVLKKPSGAHKPKDINMDDVFAALRASWKKLSRGAFVTRAYKRAEKRSGSREVAREMHKKAADLWTELHK